MGITLIDDRDPCQRCFKAKAQCHLIQKATEEISAVRVKPKSSSTSPDPRSILALAEGTTHDLRLQLYGGKE